ncbi:MAG: hypothetical protein A2096_01410 [Spirochaetes bacterium GWF1_41_5]|nr:MAG: hypothetical protein A2096_01410 [Spirochaetes bacterium GWF1_41_5]
MRLNKYISFFLYLGAAVFIYAQTPEDRKAAADLYYSMAYNANPQAQLDVIKAIEPKIGKFRPEDARMVEVLFYLGSQGTLQKASTRNELNDVTSEHRARSLALLGKLGGELARNACIKILDAELQALNGGNTEVYAAGFTALGMIGEDDSFQVNKLAARIFPRLTEKENRQNAISGIAFALEKTAPEIPMSVLNSLGVISVLRDLANEDVSGVLYHERVRSSAKTTLSKIVANSI